MQSELVTAVQEKSDLKSRLNHLECSEAQKGQIIESLNFQLEELTKNKLEEVKENEQEMFQVANRIKEKISVRS